MCQAVHAPWPHLSAHLRPPVQLQHTSRRALSPMLRDRTRNEMLNQLQAWLLPWGWK